MTAVQIEIQDDTCSVQSPYHPDFPRAAKKIAGKWKAPSWVFPASQEARVRELCRKIYGTDGSPEELVTARVTLNVEPKDGSGLQWVNECSLFLGGRQIARVLGRDSGARIGEGVVVVDGGFGSGGSRKNPDMYVKRGTIVELLDMPRTAAETLEESSDWVAKSEIVSAPKVDVESLKAERERIKLRLEEIDAILELSP